MAVNQKRLLTAENSRLGKVDIVSMLRNEDAWAALSRETREQLYALLPPPDPEDPPRDPGVNPLTDVRLLPFIEEELRTWQHDLKEGRETKKWKTEAMQAGKDHTDGKFDEWKVKAREDYWGRPGDVMGDVKGEAKGEEGVEREEGDDVQESDKSDEKGDLQCESSAGIEVQDSEDGESEL